MNVKYTIAGAVALLVGFMATSSAGKSGFGMLVLAVGPLVVVGLLVAAHYEKKLKN